MPPPVIAPFAQIAFPIESTLAINIELEPVLEIFVPAPMVAVPCKCPAK